MRGPSRTAVQFRPPELNWQRQCDLGGRMLTEGFAVRSAHFAKTISYPRQCSSVEVTRLDAGSHPTTTTPAPTILGRGFFSSCRAEARVVARVGAEGCGLRGSATAPGGDHISLAPGVSSLRWGDGETARSPQGLLARPLKINRLRADQSCELDCVVAYRSVGGGPAIVGRSSPCDMSTTSAVVKRTGGWSSTAIQPSPPAIRW